MRNGSCKSISKSKRILAASCAAAVMMGMVSVVPASANGEKNTFFGASLSLSGEIGVNLCFELYDGTFDTVRLNEMEFSAVDLAQYSVTGAVGYNYKIPYYVMPNELSKPINISLKKDGDDVAVYRSTGELYDESYTVNTYLDSVTADDPMELQALSETLATYGICAQKFADNEAGHSPVSLGGITKDDLLKYRFRKNGSLPGDLQVVGATLLIDSKTSYRVYFNKDPRDITSLTLQKTGGAYIANSALTTGENANGFYIEIPNIPAHELDDEWTLTLGDEDACTMNFCALSYAYSVFNDEDVTLSSLGKSLFAYNFAAEAYRNQCRDQSSLKESGFALEGDNSFKYNNITYMPEFSETESGNNWHIDNSINISNPKDIEFICEQLRSRHNVRGRLTANRTAQDMAAEWLLHNEGYAIVYDIFDDSTEFENYLVTNNIFSERLAGSVVSAMCSVLMGRLRSVDLDTKDQGKTIDVFMRETVAQYISQYNDILPEPMKISDEKAELIVAYFINRK